MRVSGGSVWKTMCTRATLGGGGDSKSKFDSETDAAINITSRSPVVLICENGRFGPDESVM